MHHESVLRVQKHRQPRLFYRVPIIFFQSSHDDTFKQGNSKIALVEVCSDTDLNEHELYLYCNICSETNSAEPWRVPTTLPRSLGHTSHRGRY